MEVYRRFKHSVEEKVRGRGKQTAQMQNKLEESKSESADQANRYYFKKSRWRQI